MPALLRFRPWLILAFLWAAYFHPLLLHPTQTLYAGYSDFLAEHLPSRVFLVREWRTTGELPLWNPYHFCGAPFIHDVQVGTFYPPYAVTLLFSEQCAGAVMSWAIALHVLVASAFSYLYARSRGLGETGSLVAGVGFAYSAKWLTHLLLAGHTITVGLAWLPLVLLGLEAFIRSGRKAGMLLGGVAFALLVLGTHPQWTFYAGLFVAMWTVPEERTKRNFGRWIGGGIGVVLIAVLLAAVQLLPTWEASGYSTRTSGMVAPQSFTVGMFSLLASVGPFATHHTPYAWELRSLLALFALAAAIVAPNVAPESGRWHRNVLLGVLFFCFGGGAIFDSVPGFSLFRSPSRMLLIAAFPVAFLAGTTTHALITSGWDTAKAKALGKGILLVMLLAALPSLCSALFLRNIDGLPMWPEFFLYWIVAAIGLAATGVACLATRLSPRIRTGLWLGAMFVELLAPSLRYVDVKSQSEIYPESELVQFLKANADPASNRVIDIEQGALPTDRIAPLGIGSPQALTHRIAMPRGYNPLDVRHYREYVSFITGSDEKVLALAPLGQPIVPNFPRTVPALWNQLNVRYLVCFDDYIANPEYQRIPGHLLTAERWSYAAQFKNPPLVPAIPPNHAGPMPRVIVMENRDFAKHPRAFVVPQAAAMPPGQELRALMATDLHTTVLLATNEALKNGSGSYRPIAIREYRPNHVSLDVSGGSSGWLVLADVWFPGWTCRVDGVEVPVERANHAFRAVSIPDGAKNVVFRFEPRSYRIGWWISAVSLAVVISVGVVCVLRRK